MSVEADGCWGLLGEQQMSSRVNNTEKNRKIVVVVVVIESCLAMDIGVVLLKKKVFSD